MPLLLLLAAIANPVAPDTNIRLPPNGAVEIETRSRDVTIRTGGADVVIIRGASGELNGGTLQVHTVDHRNRDAGPVEITVPSRARVEVSSVDGDLTFTGTPDRLHVETVSGAIHVIGGTGSVELGSVDGEVVVSDFHGAKLSIDATGEDVKVTNASGALTVDNVNGDILLRGIQSTSVAVSSINGAVEFEGPLAPDGNYHFDSQNDNVTLWLAADVSARLRITAPNGTFTTAIPATTSNGPPEPTSKSGKTKTRNGDADERSITVVYGSGAARVAIDAFNGDVIVKKK